MTKKRVLNALKSEMPFHLADELVPYIEEAMQIYAKECVKVSLDKAAETAKIQPLVSSYNVDDRKILRMASALIRQKYIAVSKESIISPNNIVLL